MRMPGAGARADRLARALDDPVAADEPDVAQLVAVADRLRSVEDVQLDPLFRTQLRNRLVTAAADASVMRSAAGGRADGPDELAARRRGRWTGPRAGLVAALLVLLALASLTVVLSRGALPGDSLYGVKRASEDAELQLVRGDEARGWRYLGMARTRAEEVRDLAGRQINAGVYQSTLSDMDGQTTDGIKLLNGVAASRSDDGVLTREQTWATDQYHLLLELIAKLPVAAQPDARDSLLLLRRIVERILGLRAALGCDCLGSSGSDDLGPLPCGPCAARTSGTPPPVATTAPGGPTTTPEPSAPPTSRPAPGTTAAPGSGGGGGSGPPPGTGGGGGGTPTSPAPTGGGGGGGPLPSSAPLPSVPGLPLPTEIPLPTLPLPPLPTLLPTGILPTGLLPGGLLPGGLLPGG